MDKCKILNTITFKGNIFFKARIQSVYYIKIIPCYDVEHGIVLKAIIPDTTDTTLDKSWLKIEYSNINDEFKINCPAFLSGYKESNVEVYEDYFASHNELFRMRRMKNDFSNIRHLIKVPKGAKYKPFFAKNGRLHISLAYVRNYFPRSIKKDPCIQVSSIDEAVINHRIVVSIFSGQDLTKGELAFKLKRYEYELASPPINVLIKHLKKRITRFKYKKYERSGKIISINMEEEPNERGIKGTRRCVSSLRQRVQRVRRLRDTSRRIEEEYRQQKRIINFKRR